MFYFTNKSPWLKQIQVDEEEVKTIEYRYLNDAGYPINENLATKCKVTEYDADGNVVKELLMQCIPLKRYNIMVSLSRPVFQNHREFLTLFNG